MGLLRAVLEAAKWVLVALVLGVGITVGSGNAEPYLSPSAIPGGPEATFVGMLAGVVVVIYVIGGIQKRIKSDEWEAAGRHAGLQPAGNGGLTSLPDLTGTVDGLPVTARIEKHKRNTANEGGVTWVPFTLVETELPGPADGGVIVGGDRGRMRADRGNIEVDDMVENVSAAEGVVTAETGGLSVVGTSKAAAQAVTTGPAGEALRSLEKLDVVYVGDASGVVASYADARNEEMEGSVFEFPVDEFVERVPADATTVTIETKELILNVDEFRRHVLAAVAITDTFEEVTARTPGSE